MTTKTASVGVDVDSLHHYYRIHGLEESRASNAAWDIGVRRFLELFDELDIKATFYCIGEDLELGHNVQRIREVAELGHEIGNHSFNHRYELTQLDRNTMLNEVDRCRQTLSDASGTHVVGFRSPGYNTNRQLIDVILDSGHTYDSSVFPCAPYFLAKASVMAWLAARGKPSKSILGTPKVLTAPRQPYRMDDRTPHKASGTGLLQFPISVFAGCPLIGTAFTVLGETASTMVAKAASKFQSHLTLEFHAVDLLGLREDGLDERLAVQPDLKVSVNRKTDIFKSVLKAVSTSHQFERLDRLTDRF